MKKIILILTFVFTTLVSFTQTTWTLPQFLGGNKNLVTVPGGLRVPNGIMMGTFADTNALNLTSSKFYEGCYADVAGVLHRRTNNRWVTLGGITVSSYGKNVTRDSTVLLLSNGTRFAARDSIGSGGVYPGNTDTVSDVNNQFFAQTPPSGMLYSNIARSEPLDLFVATSNTNNKYNRYATSRDGVTWVDRVFPGDTLNAFSRSVMWVQEKSMFIVHYRDTVLSSIDGINWTFRSNLGISLWGGITYIDELDLYVAIGSQGLTAKILTSPDAITWTERVHPNPTVPLWNRLAWSPQLGVMVSTSSTTAAPGGQSRWMRSSDGINWTTIIPTTPSTSWGVTVWLPTQNKFINYGQSNRIAESTNGITWTEQVIALPSSRFPTFIPERNILISHNDAQTFVSTDGINYVAAGVLPSGSSFGQFSYSNNRKITVLTGGVLSLQSPTVGVFSSTKTGLVPRSGGGDQRYLRADGSWAELTVTPTNTVTISNKNITPRSTTFSTVLSSISINPVTNDGYNMTLIADAISIGNILTATDGKQFYLRIRDDGIARSFTWTSAFRGGSLGLPTTTVVGRTIYLNFMWSSLTSTWDLIQKTEIY